MLIAVKLKGFPPYPPLLQGGGKRCYLWLGEVEISLFSGLAYATLTQL